MSDIIDEYEKWWLNELDTYHQNGFWEKIRIDEARGTKISDISVIINKSYYLINEYDGVPFKEVNDDKQIVTKRIDLTNDNVFLKDLRFILKPYRKGINSKASASYIFSESNYDKDINKLYNNTILICSEESDKFIISNEALNQSLWHELQHAYRQYCIMKENYEKGTTSNSKVDDYNFLYGLTSQLPKYYGEGGAEVRQMIYLSDKNEIDSHIQEMIPYVKRNKNMNFSNYKDYLKDNPSYKFLMVFKHTVEKCDYYATNNGKMYIGMMLKKSYLNIQKYRNLDWTIEHYFKIFYNRMKRMYLYAEHQFYKVLFYTMEEYGRKNVNEIALCTAPHLGLSDGTLEEHQKALDMMIQKMKPIDKLLDFYTK
jgi:hypothetical protein